MRRCELRTRDADDGGLLGRAHLQRGELLHEGGQRGSDVPLVRERVFASRLGGVDALHAVLEELLRAATPGPARVSRRRGKRIAAAPASQRGTTAPHATARRARCSAAAPPPGAAAPRPMRGSRQPKLRATRESRIGAAWRRWHASSALRGNAPSGQAPRPPRRFPSSLPRVQRQPWPPACVARARERRGRRREPQRTLPPTLGACVAVARLLRGLRGVGLLLLRSLQAALVLAAARARARQGRRSNGAKHVNLLGAAAASAPRAHAPLAQLLPRELGILLPGICCVVRHGERARSAKKVADFTRAPRSARHALIPAHQQPRRRGCRLAARWRVARRTQRSRQPKVADCYSCCAGVAGAAAARLRRRAAVALLLPHQHGADVRPRHLGHGAELQPCLHRSLAGGRAQDVSVHRHPAAPPGAGAQLRAAQRHRGAFAPPRALQLGRGGTGAALSGGR